MAASEKIRRGVASEASPVQRKTALAMLKRAARRELRRIFDEELKQRESERQISLSRRATASHSHS